MNSSLDLNLLLVAQQGGVEKSELPDLYAVTPPRRAARGRESDSLIIYFSLAGNSPLSPETHTQLMEQLANKFYKTPGSLTSALRTIIEALNLYLLDRNLRSTSMGRQGIGHLLLLALRSDAVYIAQCGPVHAFIIKPKETRHLYDLQSSGRGLGLSRTTPMRFLQEKMEADDYLVLANVASPGWSEATIIHPQSQGIEALRRQLLENASPDINSVIIQAQTGTGKIKMLRRKLEAPAMAQPRAVNQPTEPVTTEIISPPAPTIEMPRGDQKSAIPSDEMPEPEVMPQQVEESGQEVPSIEVSTPPTIDSPSGEMLASTTAPNDMTLGEVTPPMIAEVGPSSSGIPDVGSGGTTEPSPSLTPRVEHIRKPRRTTRPNPLARFFTSLSATLGPVGATILRALQSALVTISSALLRLLKNLLPDEDVFRLPASMMVFITIAIPLILAVVGGMVFLQRGRTQQHQVYYQKALEQAGVAANLTDPAEQRRAWLSVISDLNKADDYILTSQSQDLRAQVTANLDTMDAVKRLDYKQAIVGGLEAGVSVTRIIATTSDLYLLNGKQGNVLRAIMTGRGYEIDPNFQCGPTYGPINVGPLVDISELPTGSFENASLVGMDANGNLLYCVVGSQPYSAALAPPNTGFGEPSAMSLDRGDLYLLDQKVNAVWIYRNMEVTQQPHLFFGDAVPPMQDVIDLAVYNDDLFLLHADGHITKCTYSGMAESPTRCEDPYPYSDNRPGRVHGPFIEDAVFNQIYFSSFPERSIFLLDPQNQAIYYFSVLLTLQWQYQPKAPLTEGKATSFAISPNRTAFLAIGNYVYYAAMP